MTKTKKANNKAKKIMITFTDENGNQIEFEIIEETKINGVNYILVTDDVENEEADAYILKDVSNDEDEDAVYEMVVDESEIDYIGKVFSETMDDVEIIK